VKATDGQGNALPTRDDVLSIQNNTSCVRSVPGIIERPDEGTVTCRVELLLYDNVGNMKAPDAAPTMALVNQTGDDRSNRLGSTTMTLVSTGRYRAIYTASPSDAIEQLVWTFSVTEDAATRLYSNTTQIVDTTAVDFTSDDRSKLSAIYSKTPALAPLQDGDGALKVVDKQSGAALATAAALGTPAVGHTVAGDVAALLAALGTLSSDERNAIADALLDRDAAIDSKTVRQALQYMAAVVAGKLSGAAGTSPQFLGLDGTTPRVSATVDAQGNRTAITYDPTAE